MQNYDGFVVDEEKRDEFEKIRLAMKHEGFGMLLEQIKEHREASDTVKITPFLGDDGKNVLRSTTEELLIRQGYVFALDWVIFIVDFYRNFEENRDDL